MQEPHHTNPWHRGHEAFRWLKVQARARRLPQTEVKPSAVRCPSASVKVSGSLSPLRPLLFYLQLESSCWWVWGKVINPSASACQKYRGQKERPHFPDVQMCWKRVSEERGTSAVRMEAVQWWGGGEAGFLLFEDSGICGLLPHAWGASLLVVVMHSRWDIKPCSLCLPIKDPFTFFTVFWLNYSP